MPLTSEVHVNVALTNFSQRYHPGQFIADRVLPPLVVPKLTGTFFKYNRENVRVENDGPLGQRSPAGERDHSITTDTYSLDRYGLHDLVTREEMGEADPALDPKQDTVATLMDDILLAKEKRCADLILDSTDMTTGETLSGTGQWSDFTGGVSDPLGDFETAKESVHNVARVSDDMLKGVMGIAVWRKLKLHPSIVGRFQYTSGGAVTLAQFAELIGLKPENVLIGVSGYDTANEGQTASMGNVWGKHCGVFYAPDNPGLRTRTLGAVIQKTEAVEVQEYPNNNPVGDNVLVQTYYQYKVIDATFCYLFTNAVA